MTNEAIAYSLVVFSHSLLLFFQGSKEHNWGLNPQRSNKSSKACSEAVIDDVIEYAEMLMARTGLNRSLALIAKVNIMIQIFDNFSQNVHE